MSTNIIPNLGCTVTTEIISQSDSGSNITFPERIIDNNLNTASVLNPGGLSFTVTAVGRWTITLPKLKYIETMNVTFIHTLYNIEYYTGIAWVTLWNTQVNETTKTTYSFNVFDAVTIIRITGFSVVSAGSIVFNLYEVEGYGEIYNNTTIEVSTLNHGNVTLAKKLSGTSSLLCNNKSNTIDYLALVDITNPEASPVRISTVSGIKAIVNYG